MCKCQFITVSTILIIQTLKPRVTFENVIYLHNSFVEQRFTQFPSSESRRCRGEVIKAPAGRQTVGGVCDYDPPERAKRIKTF